MVYKLDLSEDAVDDNPHRPDLRVWVDDDSADGPTVTVSLSALFGQQQRFVDLRPEEARKLAAYLQQAAAHALDFSAATDSA